MEELNHKIKQFLTDIKDKVYLKDYEMFAPGDYHIDLQCPRPAAANRPALPAKGRRDPVAYMDYDPKTKSFKKINPDLLPKLLMFLRLTNNHHLISAFKENL